MLDLLKDGIFLKLSVGRTLELSSSYVQLPDWQIPEQQTRAVQEIVNKSAATAASPIYVKFQAVIKSAASAASPRGGRASG